MFALYLAEEKIEPEVVENMRTWPHSGFSVDQSVFLPAGDRAGIERLVGYMTRCPFSLSRLVKVTQTGQVIAPAQPLRRLHGHKIQRGFVSKRARLSQKRVRRQTCRKRTLFLAIKNGSIKRCTNNHIL